MAKNDTALLQEISGQLKKLNQSSIRDKLQERETNERQEAIWAGATAPGEGPGTGSGIVDAAEDFRRRFTASTAGAIRDRKLLPTELEAAEEQDENWFESIATSLSAKGDFYKMINNHWIDYFSLEKASGLSDEELRREKKKSQFAPGMHPNSKANWIKKGWNADESELDTPIEEKKSWFKQLIELPKEAALWVAGAVALSMYDVIKGYETGGVSGAVANFFGGTEEGGFASGIKGAFKGAGIGILAGMPGGPIGMLVGGILGGVTGAFTGSLGSEKIKVWLDEAGKNVSDSWAEMKTNWNSLTDKIGAWIHTPGEGTSATGGFKSKMFGGLIEWNPTKASGETLSSAWLTVVAKLEAAPGRFAIWFENQLRAGGFGGTAGAAIADFLFGDSPETIAKKALLIKNPHLGEAIINQSMKQALKEQVETRINEFAARGDVYTGLGSSQMNEHIQKLIEVNDALKTQNIDAKGDVIENAGEPGGVIESLLDGARNMYLDIEAFRARNQNITDLGTTDYSKPTILYDDKSDKSTTTILNSTYIDHIPADVVGSGNNSNVVTTPDGTIYSW